MINEWQLWMHPYPTMIKQGGRKVNPRYIPFLRTLNDGSPYVNLADIFEARKKRTPVVLKRCVRAVAKQYGGDVSKAFAICTAQLQKGGYLEPGTQSVTAKGKKRSKSKAAQKGHSNKVAEYEKLLKQARKKED